MMKERYYLTRDGGKEREVTVDEFVNAEMEACFHGPGHYETPKSPATAGFSKTWYPNTDRERSLYGRVDFVRAEENDWLLRELS